MLLLIFAPQPAPAQPEFINLAQVLNDLYPQLGASGTNDLIFWTSDELLAWMDEAAQKLARETGVFVAYDTSITSAIGVGTYALPSAHVATIQADLDGWVLRARTVAELEALDSNWPNSSGPPYAFVLDTQGLQLIGLYPVPDGQSGSYPVGLIMRTFPATINAGNPFVAAPTCISDYFSLYAIQKARAKESKAAMPEVAAWLGQVTGLLEQAMQQYWGGPE